MDPCFVGGSAWCHSDFSGFIRIRNHHPILGDDRKYFGSKGPTDHVNTMTLHSEEWAPVLDGILKGYGGLLTFIRPSKAL